MTLTIHEVDQRTEEWMDLRCGVVTASTVGQLVTSTRLGAIAYECPACGAIPFDPCRHKRTGAAVATLHSERAEEARQDDTTVLVLADNDKTRDVAARLAAERIAGIDPDGQLGGRDIYRGIDSEFPARQKYAEWAGAEVTECGFMTLEGDGFRLGFSPDGLVGDDGLIEIKAPRQKGHLETVIFGAVPSQHIAQIQTGLLVSGRKWCDFVSFKGGMNLWVKRVFPDPEWFKAITAAAIETDKAIEQMVNDYRAGIEGFPMTDPLPDFNEVDLKL